MGGVVSVGDRTGARRPALGGGVLLPDTRRSRTESGGPLPGYTDRSPALEVVNDARVLQGHAQILGATGGADRQ